MFDFLYIEAIRWTIEPTSRAFCMLGNIKSVRTLHPSQTCASQRAIFACRGPCDDNGSLLASLTSYLIEQK
jgi:hypothetical protein